MTTSSLPDINLNSIRHSFRPDRLIPAIMAGVMVGVLEIALATSFATLLFNGEMSTYLARGVGMALFSGAVSIALTSLLTSYPVIIGGNQDAPAAIMGVMAATIAGLAAPAEVRLATVLVAVALTTMVTGLFLFGLGTFRLAGLVRFLPYPVAGGFLAGTGWLLVTGGINTMSRVPFSFSDLPALFEPGILIYWLPGLALAILILALSGRIHHQLFMPGVIIAIGIGLYIIAAVLGVSPAELSARGWLLGPFPDGRLWLPISSAELAAVDWGALVFQLPNVIGAVVITAIALLLNASGLELALKRDIDLNREMRAAGVANMASGLGGGLVGFLQLSTSVLVDKLSGANRLTGLIAAGICGLTLWVGGSALGFVPTLVFGTLLIYLGLAFLWEWVVDAWKRLPHIDYAIVLLILGVIATFGFLQGVLVGIIATVIMFVVSYSRTSVVKHELDVATFKSRVTRNAEQRALLDSLGGQSCILQLQGFVFFGTANTLLERVRARVRQIETRHVLIDFRQVIGLDSTALLSFTKMHQLSRDSGFTLVLSGLSPSLAQQFDRGGLAAEPGSLQFMDDLDHAVEWSEDEICRLYIDEGVPRTLLSYLHMFTPEPMAQRIIGYMERIEMVAGDRLIEQGVEADHLYFTESGQLTAQLESADGLPMRLETMRGGRVVGELGFYLGTRRSAAVVADEPTVVYRLSRAKLTEIERDDPEAAHALHRIIIHLLGERVLQMVRTVEALQA